MNISISDLATPATDNRTTCNARGNATRAMVSVPLTDSRSRFINADGLFFALESADNDGHRYIQDVLARGVRNFVVSRAVPELKKTECNFIVTDSPEDFLCDSAAMIRSKISCPVVAITGSRGKTVVKELLYAALCPEFKVTRSVRSWNSRIGVPKSLWKLDHDTQIAIIEAGISQSGEMERLAEMIRPSVGVFTALTREHEAGFTSAAEKCREKALLFKTCTDIFHPADNELIASTLRGLYPDKTLHAVHSSCAETFAIEVAVFLGIDAQVAKERVSAAYGVSARIDITESGNSSSVALDHYTCDTDGILAALDFVDRRRPQGSDLMAVIGDITCCPGQEDNDYRRLGEGLAQAGVTSVFCVGDSICNHATGWTGLKVTAVKSPLDVIANCHKNSLLSATVYINCSDKKLTGALRDRLCSLRHITRLNVNLEALVHNFKYLKKFVPQNIHSVAMIKAGAYGCGAVEVARSLESAGADCFAVAVVDEGAALRHAGVTAPIIILDPWCTDPNTIILNSLEPTLMAPDALLFDALDKAAADLHADTVNVHIKLDTGMHRLGLKECQLAEFADMLARYPRLHVKSMFSHLATADCLDRDEYTRYQLGLFSSMADSLETLINSRTGHAGHISRHILNTAGLMRFGKTHHHDMVRMGIGLYGISPLAPDANLQTVASLMTTVIAIQRHNAGQTVGYGQKGVLTRDSVIATLPIGYADGLNRHLGCGHAAFYVNGVSCPTVGNICMDLCMIDVTDCPGIAVGDSVEIFGENVPIETLATALGTIPYEVLTAVSPRVKRLYYRG